MEVYQLINHCVSRRKTLQIARQLGDRALEAQACYSLGNTYTLLRDYERAIDYHMQHLQIARALRDRVGEGRACWSLGNAHTAVGNHEDARQFAVQHLEISKEVRAASCLNHLHICLNVSVVSVLHAFCGVTTEYAIPSNFVNCHFKSTFHQRNLIFRIGS